ncbi:25612_t:CDS:2 [Dentiscutata erythropus]|uniref:25612_t:CDS:1 n=1 Tax=Dentiscutata erythropus TaxID=1348616 RepID=A0A9N9FLA0_9GLOM|nr:25612_t:CDS:2 [Dentiscutata erythropus]
MSSLDEPTENYWHGDCIFYDNGDLVVEAFTPRNNDLNILKFSVKNLSNDNDSWKVNHSIFIEPTNFVWNHFTNENDKIDSNIDEKGQTYESKNLLVKWIVTQIIDTQDIDAQGKVSKLTVVIEAKKATKFDPSEEDWESVDKCEINADLLSDQNQNYVYKCELLDNGDLAMITSIGLIILTILKIKPKDKIKLRYYRGSGFPFNQKYIDYIKKKQRDILDKEDKNHYKLFIANKKYISRLLDNIKERPLLWPDFKTITRYRENKDLNKLAKVKSENEDNMSEENTIEELKKYFSNEIEKLKTELKGVDV